MQIAATIIRIISGLSIFGGNKVQVRVLDDDHNDIIVNHDACDNDYDLYAIHDIVRKYLLQQQVQVRPLDDDHDNNNLDYNAI